MDAASQRKLFCLWHQTTNAPCRLAALSAPSAEDVSDYTDLELIQHINVDCSRLTKLLNGGC